MEEDTETTPFSMTPDTDGRNPVSPATGERMPARFEVSDDGDTDTQCGVGGCKPKILQRFANISAFIGIYGTSALLTQTLSTYIMSQLTTLEKQFGFSSSVTGFITACNDIGFLVFVLLVSHFARDSHKPRILGLMSILFGVAAFVTAMPYWVVELPVIATHSDVAGNETNYTQQSLSKFTSLLCEPRPSGVSAGNMASNASAGNILDKECGSTTEEYEGSGTALFFIAVGMILQGMAKSPRSSLTATYIDDNVKKEKTGLYLGAFMFMSIFGPALAFGMGSVFSQSYVDLSDPGFGVRDPRWIGAWWLGFTTFGFLSMVIGIPVFLFPRRMPDSYQNVENEKTESKRKLSISQKIKSMFPSFLRLFTNPIFICAIAAISINAFGIGGHMAFVPKFMETHYMLDTWKANIIIGACNIFAAAIGTLVGGAVVTKFKLGQLGCIKLVLVVILLTLCGLLAMMLIPCSQVLLQGNNAIYESLDIAEIDPTNGTPACLSSCGCRNGSFFPVCGSDGLSYLSPCHGGCQSFTGMEFVDCSCIGAGTNGTAVPGYCETSTCDMLTIFMVVLTLNSLISSVMIVPFIVVIIRSIEERDKALGIGLNSFFMTLVGWMAGPVVFGWIVDRSCIFWKESCGNIGACAVYDVTSFRLSIHGLLLGARFCCLLLFVACFLFTHRRMRRQIKDGTVPDSSQNKPIL